MTADMSDLFRTEEVPPLRAISLWQPWATAVAIGIKPDETRHWSTSYRGELAIHAAKRWTREEREFASVERALGRLPARLPLGAVVAVVTLLDVRPADERAFEITAQHRLWGNYAPGRFAWLLGNVRELREPVGCAGRQSFFTLPADVTAAVRAQI